MTVSIRRFGGALAVAMLLATSVAGPVAASNLWPHLIDCTASHHSDRPLHLLLETDCYYGPPDPALAGYIAKVVLTNTTTGRVIAVPLEGTTFVRHNLDVLVTAGTWTADLWITTPVKTFTQREDDPYGIWPVDVEALDLTQRPTAQAGAAGHQWNSLLGGTSDFLVRFTQPVTGASASTIKVYGPSGTALAVSVSYDKKMWDATVTLKNGATFTSGTKYKVTVSSAIKNSKGKTLRPFTKTYTAR